LIRGEAFFIAPTSFMGLFITNTEAEKSISYGGRKTRFVEVKKAKFGLRLN
jgi:hypothetical protein